jgi:hypothetical protein
MESRAVRVLVLMAAVLIVFGTVVMVGLRLLPAPHTESDYLVVGSVATFIALGVLFLTLISTWVRTPHVFYRKRDKPPEG